MISTLEPAAVEEAIARIIRDELLLGSEREIPLDQPLGELGVGLAQVALGVFDELVVGLAPDDDPIRTSDRFAHTVEA